MFRKSASAIATTARELLLQWRALAAIATLYLLLLTGLYLFVTTKEATKAQVAVTIVLSIAAPVLFFILQTAITKSWTTKSGRALIVNSLRDSWKLLLVSVPVVAICVLLLYLLNKLQGHFDARNYGVTLNIYQPPTPNQATRPIHWGTAAVISARYLLLCVLAPLTLIHLWISASDDGLGKSLLGLFTKLKRAFATTSVLIYTGGFLVFGVIPYFLLNHNTPASRPWLQLGLFAAKLVAVFCLTLIGWLVTIRALAMTTAPRTAAAAKGA